MTKKGQSMSGFIGKVVKINRGGPESFEGTLITVYPDYLVVYSKEGFVYVKNSHVKSITEAGHSHGTKYPKHKMILSHDFLGIIKSLRLHRVQINQGGPEKLEGVLVSINHHRLIMVLKNNEIVRVSMYHIKTISALVSGKSNKNGENKDNKSKENNNSKDNQSKEAKPEAANSDTTNTETATA